MEATHKKNKIEINIILYLYLIIILFQEIFNII